MDMHLNQLKRALRAGRTQTGCWLSLASHVSAEICASAGMGLEQATIDLAKPSLEWDESLRRTANF
jgi:2-keto-3-deoxy-L-rhamnonate aldolase RhmA